MFKIVICDDSPLWLQKVEALTKAFFQKTNSKYSILLLQSGEKLLRSPLASYDIALLDVDLKSTNGIEIASKLRTANPQIVLIFVSEYVEYAPFGYEVDAIRYLLKNHLEQTFDRVMSEASVQCNWTSLPTKIPGPSIHYRISIAMLEYVEKSEFEMLFDKFFANRFMVACCTRLRYVQYSYNVNDRCK